MVRREHYECATELNHRFKKVALLDFVVEDNNYVYARLLRAIANTPTGDTKSLP